MTASATSYQEFWARPLLTALPGGLDPSAEGTRAHGPDHEEPPPASGVMTRIDALSPDHVLAIAAGAGNARAAAIILRRYSSRVRAKLHRWLGGQDIDDNVQDVFIRLFEQLPRLRDPNALRGFINGITLRIACTELRRRRRSRLRLTTTGQLPEPADLSTQDRGMAREAVWRFESILERLAPRSRRVFVLRYVDKLELTDVAAHMGISLATAKRHLARAAATVTAMIAREPALAEYLPTQARWTR